MRYRVSYQFTTEFTGDAEAITQAMRDMTWKEGFEPGQIVDWMLTRPTHLYNLRCPRTISEDIHEATPRAALRKFLYNEELPDDIDVTKIRVEPLEPVLAEVAA